MTITADEIRKAALELIEKVTMSQHVIVGAKADEMMRLNEIKTQVALVYINGVCSMARKLTDGGTKNDN